MWRIERNRNKISNVVDNAKIWTNLSHPFRDYLIQISPPPPPPETCYVKYAMDFEVYQLCKKDDSSR